MSEYYIFTFGQGQEHAGKYVKIYGSYNDARDKMFDRYDDKWAFQYSAEEWKKWEERRPAYLDKIETLLEEIE